VQALATGLALVVSDIGGFADLVRNGENGFLCPVQDEAIFAERLRSLLCSPDRLQAFRVASREHARHFDLEHIAAAYDAVLQGMQPVSTFSEEPLT
ncbi:MAG: glycosyltransferase, partial [Anaerolineae bacterium]